ncbi:TPA: ProQ/FINO family protein [Salmonella enterica subsp. enterica serovar Muenchen]
MTADTVKKSPVIVVKKKRQFTLTPVTENVAATPAADAENITAPVTAEGTEQLLSPPSGMSKKQRKYLRRKQERRDRLRNGRLKLPLFRQVFPLLWPEDHAFRLVKVGITRDAEDFVNANPDCGLSPHDCRCVFAWVTRGLPYLRLFSPGAVRYDLNGLPAGTVSDREVLHARQITESILRFQARKVAESQQPAAHDGRDGKND